jgi:DNA-binding NarL/FixJ family response regulator
MLPTNHKISIHFVEEFALYREGLLCLFRELADLEVSGGYATGAELLEKVLTQPADITLIDLHLSDIHAFELIRKIRASGNATRLILLASRADPKSATEAIRSGAHGLILKSSTSAQLIDAIGQVMGGAVFVDPRVELAQTLTNVVRQDPNDPLESLSSREHQVFTLLIEGIRAKEIAARLAVSPKTVDTYRASLMRKLNIHDVAGLVKYAIQRQLITAD